MNDKIEETIKEVAARHGIALGRDDPIMILLTINELLMKDSSQAQRDALGEFKSDLEEVAQRWGKNATDTANKALNAALSSSKEVMTNNLDNYTNEIATKSAKKLSRVIDDKLSAHFFTAKSLTAVNLLCALTYVGCTIYSIFTR